MKKTKTKLTFAEFSRKNRKRSPQIFPECYDDGGDYWTLGDWGNALAGEIGEACNKIKKLRRGETHDKDGDLKTALAKELADAYTYLDIIAGEMGIDIEAALIQKFNEVSVKKGSRIFLK